MADTAVLCGGVELRRPGSEVRHLDVAAPRNDPKKVNLKLGHITRHMAVNVPGRLVDLLEIACYIYCADQFVSRGSQKMTAMGARWRRSFRFHIPVRELALWQNQEVKDALVEAVSFLSEDDYEFVFIAATQPSDLQPYLDLDSDGAPGGFRPERIVLFSGGLDSFAGAAEMLLKERQTAVLVSHQASPLLRATQADLVDALRQRCEPRQVHHVGVDVNKAQRDAKEYTQRSRSFLFAALGYVVARLFQRDELVFYENGVVSLNLPVAEHVIGARATRTTHPRVLRGFARLFSLLAGSDIQVHNPYFWLTKTDVIRRLEEVECVDLIKQTFSCTRTRQGAMTGTHCGVCSQCLDRRLAIVAAGYAEHEPDAFYKTALFDGERDPGVDVTLAVSYVHSASDLAQMTLPVFLARYGQVFRALPFLEGPTQENAARLHALHVRHGKLIMQTINEALADAANRGVLLDLPDSCLLSLLQAPSARRLTEDATVPQVRLGSGRRGTSNGPIGFAIDDDKKRVVFGSGVAVVGAGYKLIEALAPYFRDDQGANRLPEEYRTIRTDKLAKRLMMDDQSLRQLVTRTRRSLQQQFNDCCDRILDQNDIIENVPNKGYRLNPKLVVQSLAILEPKPR